MKQKGWMFKHEYLWDTKKAFLTAGRINQETNLPVFTFSI